MSKKWLWMILLIIAAVDFAGAAVLFSRREEVRFIPSEGTLVNPSRGFYVQIDSSEKDRLKEEKEKGVRLLLAAFDIEAYKDRPIGEEKLKELEKLLEEMRQYGFKAIFRAAYGFEDTGDNDAASLKRIEQHIEQISEVLNRNRDVLLCVQAGFLGPWGEWHSCRFYQDGDEGAGGKVRSRVLKSLYQNLHPDISIALRRPRFIREAAENGMALARLGYHNDGLLASDTDLGTYDDEKFTRKAELSWAAKHLKAVTGGEMPAESDYTKPESAVKEFEQLKLTFLNLEYNKKVLESWKRANYKGENAYTYIEKRLGYRYYLKTANYPKSWYQNPLSKTVNLSLTIGNEGFAPVERGYELQLVIADETGKIEIYPASISLSRILGGGEKQVKIALPKGTKKETRRLGLRLIDKQAQEPSAVNCIQLANTGFSYENGINYFGEVDGEGKVFFYR